MNTSFRLFALVGFLASSLLAAPARIERLVEKTFTVSGTGTLKVETHGGAIEVMPSAGSEVKVTAKQRIRADSDAEADQLLEKLTLTMEQDGNEVRLVSKYEKRPFAFSGSWPPVNVDFVVSVPKAFASDLKTSGGSITVGDLEGPAKLHTSGGNIKLGKMGGSVDAHTSGGNVSLASARAGVQLRTSGGNISAGPVNGPAEISTSGGNINVDSVESALRARTSGGNIRAAITGPLKEECVLTTSGGTVRVNVDKAAAFQLDASTSGGNVDAQGLTLTTDKITTGRSKLAGAVNGGGPLLKLRSSGGGISVRAN